MASRGKLERQRERIRALLDADPQRSSRSIALEIGCGVNTVIRTASGMFRETPRTARLTARYLDALAADTPECRKPGLLPALVDHSQQARLLRGWLCEQGAHVGAESSSAGRVMSTAGTRPSSHGAPPRRKLSPR
ncbi:MAG: hypothetical protein JWM66_1092 [Solirubrobacterales bacterium]|nr:hypothetical protein [Solirubrobacterales bacterium]